MEAKLGGRSTQLDRIRQLLRFLSLIQPLMEAQDAQGQDGGVQDGQGQHCGQSVERPVPLNQLESNRPLSECPTTRSECIRQQQEDGRIEEDYGGYRELSN